MIRIVKMTFKPAHVATFQQLFAQRKAQIAAFDGCQGVTLLQDNDNPAVFFTYSHWQSAAHLEQYRQSAFFKDTWEQTKALFAAKPAAWSTEIVNEAQ